MPRLDGTRQTGRRQHEWGIIAQTSRPARERGALYVEVDFCELCRHYRIYEQATDTEQVVKRLPSGLPELQRYDEPGEVWKL